MPETASVTTTRIQVQRRWPSIALQRNAEPQKPHARWPSGARAWEVAEQAAALLKEQFGATQVALFGSTVHGHWFSTTSDVDLAASGLASDDYFTAVARLQDLSSEFKVDLVALEHCKAELRESIAREGVIL